MLEKLLKCIEKERLFSEQDRLLVAVSGGKDSMVLLHLMKTSQYEIAVAHINHTLREEESKGDQELVKNYCSLHSIPFHTQSFDTQSEVDTSSTGLQDVARRIRYEYLESLCAKHSYDYILTAHHMNDNVETLLQRMIKGSGMLGLSSIPWKRGNIVRPLLSFTRDEIDEYQDAHSIPYREDRSNSKLKYDRNRIRHQLLPVLQEINRSAIDNIGRTIENVRDTQALLTELIAENITADLDSEDGGLRIPKQLLDRNGRMTLLYYLISPYGFNRAQTKDILTSKDSVGAQFSSDTHQLLIDRSDIIIRATVDSNPVYLSIDGPGTHRINADYELSLSEVKAAKKTPDPRVEYVDKDLLTFPLTIRGRLESDTFQPLGMQGQSQKLKDFFIHQKVNRFEKESSFVLCSADEICWVLPHRLDHRYRVTEETKAIMQLKFTAIS